jgi:hypothetical protein
MSSINIKRKFSFYSKLYKKTVSSHLWLERQKKDPFVNLIFLDNSKFEHNLKLKIKLRSNVLLKKHIVLEVHLN